MLKVEPGLLKVLATVVAGGLGVLAAVYPAQAVYFLSLASGLVGSALVRRPGDAPVAGVHPDDLPGAFK
jgi:hypothetical protein